MSLCVQGDATYLIVKKDGTITDYGLNAVCTHLGCVVPWNAVRFAISILLSVRPTFAGRIRSRSARRAKLAMRDIDEAPVPASFRPRTSSSARATALSTTTRARSSAARPRWCV